MDDGCATKDTCAHRVQRFTVKDVDVVHCMILKTGSGLNGGEKPLKRFRESADFLVLSRQTLHPAVLVLIRAVRVLHPVDEEHVPAPGGGGDHRPPDQDHLLTDLSPALVRGRPLEEGL